MAVITETKCSSCGRRKLQADCERCRLVWIVNAAGDLREAQNAYAEHKRPADLEKARLLGQLLDVALKRAAERHEQESFKFGHNV